MVESARLAAPASQASQFREADRKKEPYIGSVRFFKHLFLGILLALIIVPTVICVVLTVHISTLNGTERELRSQLEAVQQELLAQSELAQGVQAVDADIPSPSSPPADLPPYSALYPDFYAPEANYSSIVTDKVCYLTFDDGPSARTDEILDILEQENVKATFFVTKQDSEENRARLKRAADAGHTIALHSASHEYNKIYSSVEAFLDDYYELYTWVLNATGQKPTIFRFPGGSINGYNRTLYQELIAEMTRRGFVYFDWNVSSADAAATPPPAATLRDNCLQDMPKFSRPIVLMHDSSARKTTVAALPEIIAGARDQGFTFDSLNSEVKPVIFSYRE